MRMWRSAPLALLLWGASSAYAQSTAQPVTPGYLTTSGCPAGYTVCFVPYSNSNPLPVSVANANPNGQAPMANSAPVTMASNQAPYPIYGFTTAGVYAFPEVCGSTATVSPSTATDTQIVALSSGKNIYVCSFSASSNGNNNFYLESATAGSCGGSLTQMGNTWYTTQYWAKAAVDPFYRGMNTGANNALCVHTTAAQNLSVTVYYDQY